MIENDRLMGLREFLRGGYRDISEPTTIIGTGLRRLFVILPLPDYYIDPEDRIASPRSAHPDPNGGSPAGDRAVSPGPAPVDRLIESGTFGSGNGAATGLDEQTEAPRSSRTVEPPPGRASERPNVVPARRPSAQAVLDRAAKEGRS